MIILDVPLVFYKTKYGMVLCAIGNEESADTDSGEKVSDTLVTRAWFAVRFVIVRLIFLSGCDSCN